jgi:general secretion pathway protein H
VIVTNDDSIAKERLSRGARRVPFALKRDSRGFTLIEIMIVIAIIAGIIAIGAPKLFSSSASMRTAVRKLAVLTREVRNNSRLYNVTSRLVISIGKEKGDSYWVESAEGVAPLMTEDQEKEIEKLTEIQKESSVKSAHFQQDSRVLKGTVTLPKGLHFEEVEYGAREKSIGEGNAMIHFFPQGISEEVAIHLTDHKTLNWTITINPLTGRADVFEKKVTLKELRNK